jgi:Cu+-exporting ATPase
MLSLPGKMGLAPWLALRPVYTYGGSRPMPSTAATIDQPRTASDGSGGITMLRIEGMTCGNCARHVAEALQAVPGVQYANVTLQSSEGQVRWRADADTAPAKLIRAVEDAGFSAETIEPSTAEPRTESLSAWKLNLWLGALITAPLMIGEWVLRLGPQPWFRWASFILAGIVQIWAGAAFYRGAWRQLKRGSSNMDTLVTLGSTTAFVYSVWALFCRPGAHLYFLEAAAIITLISIGHWLEARIGARASSALRELLTLAPARALRQMPDGSQTDVSVSELRVGDTVVLRPGDHVPVDGTVVDGGSAVDETMLTGESLPVEKKTGQLVYAGTVNLDGRLLVRVSGTGEETALAHIINAVQRAQTSRADIQRLGDRVSNVFVPIVVVIAIAAALWWGLATDHARSVSETLSHFLWMPHLPEGALASALIIGAAVLIVACPCAMGLATPAAIMAASNAAARKGILVRDGVALEKAGTVSVIVFDKTGTLTIGKPEVASIQEFPTDGLNPSAKELAIALARNSKHPISQAIAKLGQPQFQVEDWEELRGSGVRGGVALPNGQRAMALLGSLNWLKENGVELAAGEDFIQKFAAEGASISGLAIGKRLAGLFAVRDTVKPGAGEIIRDLQARGLKTFLITGDTRLTATSVARDIGIPQENVFPEIRPEDKARIVSELQAKGEKVAFIGDGINDAPALEQADLGIAVARAADVAREAADMVLLNSEIKSVPESLDLARSTLRVIKQNLFWAFFYNALGIPLAALGFMSPILCAGAMAVSDLIVIGNALRLLRRKA